MSTKRTTTNAANGRKTNMHTGRKTHIRNEFLRMGPDTKDNHTLECKFEN
ncbi:unnamed protein product [Scytosiphon promiscuus]